MLRTLLLVSMFWASTLACAFQTEPLSMVPERLAAATPQPATVNVRGTGGSTTRLWGKSQVSDSALTEAVESALADSGLFLPLEDRAGDYQLEIAIERLDQPTWSLVTTVQLRTRWSFSLTGAADPIWSDAIVGTHTATLLDALIGTKRLRLATEGATRQAIREGLLRLSRLRL